MQCSKTPLATLSPNRPVAPHDAKSPSPAKPTPTRGTQSPAAYNNQSPGHHSYGGSPGVNLGMYQAGECMCPTCQYYKACYMYHQEAHSPEMAMASYQMYQYGYYPFGAGNSPMPQQHAGSQPSSHYPQQHHGASSQGRGYSPMPTGNMMMPSSHSMNHHQSQAQAHMQYPSADRQLQFPMPETSVRLPSVSMPTMSVPRGDEGSMAPSAQHQPGPRQGGNPVVEQFQQSIGNIAKIACSANGRTMLQGVMRLQHLDKIQTIFDEIVADADGVMLDSHGCHVVRSLIEVIDEHQLTKLTETLHSKLILNMCTLSQYTRKILQTLFERHRSINLQSIVDIMSTNAGYLAATQQGCISLMRVFERCNAEQKHSLVQPLMKAFADLATDPFGNYVVQCVLEHSEPMVSTRYALDCFNGEFLKLACNKFGSNVCEKIIRVGNQNLRRLILDELIFNPAALQQASNDSFGNFVIQTLIETCNSPTELKKVCDRLRPAVAGSPYGHKIEAKIRSKRFPNQPVVGPLVTTPTEAEPKPVMVPVTF